MTPRTKQDDRSGPEARKKFEAQKARSWTAGEYGSAVRVFLEAGKLKLSYQVPVTKKQRQVTLFGADTGELRKRAAAIAVAKTEELRRGIAHQVEREATGDPLEDLTIERVALLYMRRAPGFPEELLAPTDAGVKTAVERWHAQLPEETRNSRTCPSAKSLWSDVYAFRRLFQDPRFARGRRVMELQPADATEYCAEQAAKGTSSPRTAVNDTDRLSCAIRYVMQQYRKKYPIPYNPLEGRIVDRTRAEVAEYTEEEVGKLLTYLMKQPDDAPGWQIRGFVGIARAGRRLSAILALTESDHDLTATPDAPHGTCTWQAEHAKGEGYGRGDEVIPMTALHREALDWLLEHHRNPEGPEYPLLWKSTDPKRPIRQNHLDRQLKKLQTRAGVTHKRGRSFHGFCRTAITLLADALGDGPAAEFTGRTPDTIRRYSYKKKTMKKLGQAAGALSRER